MAQLKVWGYRKMVKLSPNSMWILQTTYLSVSSLGVNSVRSRSFIERLAAMSILFAHR